MNKEQAAPVVVVGGGGIGSMFLAALIDNIVFIFIVLLFIFIIYMIYRYRKVVLALWQAEQVIKTKENKKEEKKNEPNPNQHKGDEAASQKQAEPHHQESKH